jgi:mediator of RNA polymerase II transcription subunit 14
MPGIRIMNHSGSDAAAASRDGENKKRNHEGNLVSGERNDARRDTPARGPDTNGGLSKNTTNGASMAVAAPAGSTLDQYSELPPEIQQVSSDAYHSLSTLLLRISQESYNDLGGILSKMAEIQLAPATNGVLTNGLGAANMQNNAEANKRKKLLLLQFAQDQRAKFIKVLVLTEWGKKAAGDISKLIDLFSWASEQARHMDSADVQLEKIKVLSNIARENNPDIATALEVLSTGKASWMPHLGYAPHEPVSSEHALKLLRYMNTSLSIRLNVHETLPRHLKNWRIHSGRATFVIDHEMEFDVMSFVEDSSEQWFLIDVRLLFTPAPIIVVGSRFFMQLKAQADFVLKDKGLSGLFDFLHNFILTHKISVLRSQAVGLVRAGWVGSLEVQPVHRQLVVSYWTNKPGKKNWIEIGISSHRPKNGKVSWRGPSIPSLTARWFRQGMEVVNANLKLDWKDLSMERIIKQLIARHTSDLLRSTQQCLKSGVMANARLSDVDPANCTLQATLGTKSTSITLSLEPVTGNYIMRPASALSARAEGAFNQGREPAQMANVVTQVLAGTLLNLIQKNAQQLGWPMVAKHSLHQQKVASAVKLDVLASALYCPRGWSPNWALAVVMNSSGDSWWIFEIGPSGNTIECAEQIRIDRPDGSSLPIDRKTLASLERVAVLLVSFRVTARRLDKEKKPYTLGEEMEPSKTSTRVGRRWALHVQTSDILVTKAAEEAWLESDIRITCDGLQLAGQNVWLTASGRMVKAIAADMQKLMAASPQKTFKFSEDGTFKILLAIPFGQDILGELRARLRDVNRLRAFATTLRRRAMTLRSSSLQGVQFQYGPSLSHNSITLNFSSINEFTLGLSPDNPHHRVHHFLTEIANDRLSNLLRVDPSDTNGLDRLCSTLIVTRSLLKVLQEIELKSPGNLRNPAIHVHSILKYRLTYDNPVCTFDINLKPKDDEVYWFVEDNLRIKGPDVRPTPERAQGHRRLDVLQTKLKDLFSASGEGWFGTRNGMVAKLHGIPAALRKLNEVVLSCKMAGGYVAPPPLPQATQQQPQNQGQDLGQALAQAQANGSNQQQQQQQARMQQQARAQQQQQAQGQQQRKQQPQQNPRQQQQQQSGRPGQQQLPNGRPPQHQQPPPNGRQQQAQQQQQQMGRGGRPGQSKTDVIEID